MKIREDSFGLSEEVVYNLSMTFESVTGVNEVVIFGSRAKGNYSEGSDIDLAVKGSDITLDTILEIKIKIEDLGLLYKVDIQNYHTIRDKDVVDHIDRAGKLIWKRNGSGQALRREKTS
ncbi:MAG: nucleotidyltransferase domain-containing protein [Cyclobacteriaceae bacterium]